MKHEITIGMATYDDWEGVWPTVRHLQVFHRDVNAEIIVVDNNPTSPSGKRCADFAKKAGIRYIEMDRDHGTSQPRNRVFEEATSDLVMCIDPHILIEPGAIRQLLNYAQPSKDIFSGPCVLDNWHIHTGFADIWRGGMWGTWETDSRGTSTDNPPYECFANGLGLFAQFKEHWLGFNKRFRGFGGEECYYHEKVRQNGGRHMMLPFLRWYHRFGHIGQLRYAKHATNLNKVRNYIIGCHEIGKPLDDARRHFVDEIKAITADVFDQLAASDGETSAFVEKNEPATSSTPWLSTVVGARDAVEFTANLETTWALVESPIRTIHSYIEKDSDGVQQLHDRLPADKEFTTTVGAGVQRIRKAKSTELLVLNECTTFECARYALETFTSTRFIVLRNTKKYGEIGSDSVPPAQMRPGVLSALRMWLTSHPEWSVIKHFSEGEGFTVLSRLDSDKKQLPGKIEMAANFTKALANHVVTGAKETEPEELEKRLATCTLCEHRNGDHCGVCGCPIAKKASWKDQHCPLRLW